MIDIHSHILPGLDDGPAHMDESIRMARIAADDGIGVVVATPHCLNGIYTSWRSEIMPACEELNHRLRENRIPLTVLPGSEVHLDVDIPDELARKRIMTLNDTGRYLSVELPDPFIPETVIRFFSRLRDMNITPVLSHPERNGAIQNNITLLHHLVRAGALTQLTGDSLLGRFGKPALRCFQRIIEEGLIHTVASDSHSAGSRSPRLSPAYKKLSGILGREKTRNLFFHTPRMILGLP